MIPPAAHAHRRTLTDNASRSAAVLHPPIAPRLGFGTKRPRAARKCSNRTGPGWRRPTRPNLLTCIRDPQW